VTVCIAAQCAWANPNGTLSRMIITASDRMITAGDIEYEPPQRKICFLTKKALILIAGDYPPHSEALMNTQRNLASEPVSELGHIAEIFAGYLRACSARFGEQTYLSPFGLTLDDFVQGRHGLSADLVSSLANSLLNEKQMECEAIVVGADDFGAHLYLVDQRGRVSCHDDVGFIAIGIGAPHAKSQFMASQFSSNLPFIPVLALLYAAKRRAEAAPGVGLGTDMFMVGADGWEEIWPETMESLRTNFENYETARKALAFDAVKRIQGSMEQTAEKRAAARAQAQAQAQPQPSERQTPKDQPANPATSSKDQTRSET